MSNTKRRIPDGTSMGVKTEHNKDIVHDDIYVRAYDAKLAPLMLWCADSGYGTIKDMSETTGVDMMDVMKCIDVITCPEIRKRGDELNINKPPTLMRTFETYADYVVILNVNVWIDRGGWKWVNDKEMQ